MKAPSKDQLLQDVLSDSTWSEIATKYGYSDSRFLRKLARRYGLPNRRTFLKPSEQELRHLIFDKGLSPYQIADKLGYGKDGWSNIYAYCREYGITFDHSPNYKLRAVPFTQRQKDITLGSLLGDAYLRHSKPNDPRSCSLSFTHGEKQKSYLEWKLAEFDNFVTTKKLYKSIRDSKLGNDPTYTFSTISHPYLCSLRELCYPNGIKRITWEWLDLLSPLSLAVWYMDDGSINKRYKTIVICTNCFTLDEQTTVIDFFANRLGIESVLEPRRNNQTVIRINASQRYRFLDIIAPHIPDCMLYKLG